MGLNVYNLFNTYDSRGNGNGTFGGGITGTPVIGRTLPSRDKVTAPVAQSNNSA